MEAGLLFGAVKLAAPLMWPLVVWLVLRRALKPRQRRRLFAPRGYTVIRRCPPLARA